MPNAFILQREQPTGSIPAMDMQHVTTLSNLYIIRKHILYIAHSGWCDRHRIMLACLVCPS